MTAQEPSRARAVILAATLGCLSGCAALHRVMLSDVESRAGGRRISVKVSETTVDLGELADTAKFLGKASGEQGLGAAGDIIEYYQLFFQWGPRTGVPVFNEKYARKVPEMLEAKCPGGRVTNIVSVREAREYPIIKGEIVRIDALCQGGGKRGKGA